MKRRIALLLAVFLLLAGCGEKTAAKDLMQDVTIPGQAAGTIGAEVATADTAWDNALIGDFGLRLLQESLHEGENILISPMSVLHALTMTANGAAGDTLQQMERVLGQSVDALNSWYKYGAGYEDTFLHQANSIWLKDDPALAVEESFLQTNGEYFGAGVYQAPFDNTTIKDINGFVEKHTRGMVSNILDEIPEDAVLYLVNALAFEAQWETVYKENNVRSGEFTTEDGRIQPVKLMYSEEKLYLENDLATGFRKPYKSGKTSRFAFVALLPKEGVTVAELVQSLDGESLRQLLTNPQSVAVNAAIPKFETEYDVEMEAVLKSMGMTDAFDASLADFSAMATYPDANIYISSILHKTFLSVAEKGTKAGAVTVVEAVKESAAEVQSKQVKLDRPFVYMIVDTAANIPVFLGVQMEI